MAANAGTTHQSPCMPGITLGSANPLPGLLERFQLRPLAREARSWHYIGMNRVLMWGACATLVLTGCATSPPPSARGKGGALTPEEVHGFYQKARDARHFWLHVANTDHGPRFDGAHQAKQDHHTELDFIGPGDTFLPLIYIEDNLPNRYNALIDTSSAENWVGLTESRSMWLVPIKEPAYRTQPTHLADPVDGFLCLGEKIRVGSIVVNNALFFTRGWHNSLRGPLLRGVQKPVPQ